MKTLTLSLLLLALTACTANPTKTPAPMNLEGPSKKVAETTPPAPNTEVQKETPVVLKRKGSKVTPAQAAKNCICVKMWMPVCGTNDKTYGNSCEADCAGVKYTQGECEVKK